MDIKIDNLCINTIRTLSIDAIEKAKSGHPGMPLGAAPIVHILWKYILKHNPKNPQWYNRDRFILSAGHGCMLLYSILHLCGYNISLAEIKQFRQFGSKTAGHPERAPELGIEVTTGPLGQGIANGVGIAIAERYLASYFNKKNYSLFDYHTFVLCGDGCLQEGISYEACSLAGHLQLNKLIVLYDCNKCTIDGELNLAYSEDTAARFKAIGWDVKEIDGNGSDLPAIKETLEMSKISSKPVLIISNSTIGYGSPNKAGKSSSHGAPLGKEEILLTKKKLDCVNPPFFVAENVYQEYIKVQQKGEKIEKEWDIMLKNYTNDYSILSAELNTSNRETLLEKIKQFSPIFSDGLISTRKASQEFIEKALSHCNLILGGSADLTNSNNTKSSHHTPFTKNDGKGRYIYFGIREHAMGGILNGINQGNFIRAYGGTFLCFSDYMRPSIRLAALSHIPSIFILTHDSIGLGEDGPTHQPVEHLCSLRAIPNLCVFRPADANETVLSWQLALQMKDTPSAIVLSRQDLPILNNNKYPISQLKKGGYVLKDEPNFQMIIMATGSEVHLALSVQQKLLEKSIPVRVVSFPCLELFEMQDNDYKEQVLPSNICKRIVVEAGVEDGWWKYLGNKGRCVCQNEFGKSAPAEKLFHDFGFSVSNIVSIAEKLLS